MGSRTQPSPLGQIHIAGSGPYEWFRVGWRGLGMEKELGIEVGDFAVALRDVKAESLVLKILTSSLT